ncbi:hypothetical protein [Microcoleus sp. F4-D5]|uniref:hypothetical protein n=1 Tax=Microcoleus sp. F4-D5 TaxID=2818760 RepID=UPI002FD6F7EA
MIFKKTYKHGADPSQGELEADPRFKDDENFILERIAPAMLNKMLERLPLLLAEGIDYKATREAMREAQEESRHLWQFVRDLYHFFKDVIDLKKTRSKLKCRVALR